MSWERGGLKLYCSDCVPLLERMASDSIDMFLTDPPYRVDDLPVWAPFAAQAYRLLKPGRSLVALTGHVILPDILDVLRASGLRYWWVGGMRHTAYKRLPGKWVTVMWKPAVWFVKTERKGTRTPFDLILGGGKDKRYHKWGQPVYWFAHWITNLTEPGELVCDPFLGGGTTAMACLETGRQCIGMEVDPTVFAGSVARLKGAASVDREPQDRRQ